MSTFVNNESLTTSTSNDLKQATFSTTLPDGQKMTINTGFVGFDAVRNSVEQLEGEEKEKSYEQFREELIKNTDELDSIEVEQEVAEMAANYTKPVDEYSTPVKFESTVVEDDESIEPKSRQAYVWYFKAHQRKTSQSSLLMSRVVYEAHKTLEDHEFSDFCDGIGLKADSSTIRKFIVVGRVYPRLIKYVDQLPAAWTSIYALTQMPADDFERCIESGYRLCDLSGGEIDELVKKTRQINNLMSPFKLDKKEQAYCIAKVYFTKKMDDLDLRIIQKAFDEISSRLPVKLSIEKQVLAMHKERANQRYQKLKKEDPNAAVKPETWDYGVAANAVYNKDAA